MPGKKREVIIVFLVLALDQLTKLIVTANLTLHDSIPLVKGVFSLTLIHNRGAAFGIFKNQLYIFIFISLIAVALIYSMLKNNKSDKLYSLSLSLILAGALGNLLDRVFLGYVIDFLDFHIWPVFNIADSAITCGTLILGWVVLRPNSRKYAS
ncbi:MAG: signal peptidase II [Candidatus Omnitrophica bacterium]|jgi:signal peptidase II|nr:signal peptidase II [Candidatus Omnitrophota bacterium]MDD4982151.1 signal peptidase II [Candidatus Omnitrophota bacterium]